MITVDCIADLHGHYPELDGGDLLIVAGDLTAMDTDKENIFMLAWLECQKYKKIIFVAGNHDNFIQERAYPSSEKMIYLCDSGTEFEGLKIWGSPWTKTFPEMNPKCKAFTCETDSGLAENWALIPEDIDVLITHSPPYGILDTVRRYGLFSHEREENVGSYSLLVAAKKLRNLKLFVFGHIHGAQGHYKPEEFIKFAEDGDNEKVFGHPQCKSFPHIVNASHVNEYYEPVNNPMRVIL
jgi:Icc-related predicted phosphoesterase